MIEWLYFFLADQQENKWWFQEIFKLFWEIKELMRKEK